LKKNDIIGKHIPVLDKGFVRVVDLMGDDGAVVQAARVSYGDGNKKVSDDLGLINYLMRHDHTTPFEMAEMKLHIKCPMFVARQWMRHRTASVNEVSARYSYISDDFYIPKPSRVKLQSTTNKQKSGEKKLDPDLANQFVHDIESSASWAKKKYKIWAEDNNVARELARIDMPMNLYTEFYWKIDVHNLMHFLRLRMHDTAQEEIQSYAKVIYDKILKEWMPLTWCAFRAYKVNSMQLTEYDIASIRGLLSGKDIGHFPTSRERAEFKEKMIKLGLVKEEQA
jgi:thymidylate synthase (FAD)